jgi:integrase
VKAFDPAQLDQLLTACRARDAALYPLLLTLARTGMRPGEAYAMRWEDVDLGRAEIRIERAVSRGRIETPKTGHGRTVKASPVLLVVLREKSLQRGAQGLAFPSEAGTLLDHHNVAKRFKRVVRAAKLPQHHTLYCLRHTFASILLAAGVSPAYVQEQLGHASIELTVGTYGRWLRKQAPGADAALDGEASMVAVANSAEVVAASDAASPQVVESVGDPGRARTFNPEIKSVSPGREDHDDDSLSHSFLTCEDLPSWW